MLKQEPNHPVPDIDKIIVDCQNGNRQAQKMLYEHFAPRMFATCLRYSRNRMEAEDLLHEGFIKVFTKIGQYRKTGPFEAWMRRLMVNTILEEFRKNKRITFVDDKNLPGDLADEQEEYSNNETPDLNQIMQLVNELPERYQMVFNLHVVEGLTHEEIAKELEISIGTSKSNLSRARQWLKNRIANTIMNKHKILW